MDFKFFGRSASTAPCSKNDKHKKYRTSLMPGIFYAYFVALTHSISLVILWLLPYFELPSCVKSLLSAPNICTTLSLSGTGIFRVVSPVSLSTSTILSTSSRVASGDSRVLVSPLKNETPSATSSWENVDCG